MKLTVTIEVDDEEYKKAIVAGWHDRFGEELEIDDIKLLDNPDDFIWATRHFIPSSIRVEVELT